MTHRLGGLALAVCALSACMPARHWVVDPRTEVGLIPGWSDVDLAFNGTKYHVLAQQNDGDAVHANTTYTFLDPSFHAMFSVSTAETADYELRSVRLFADRSARTASLVVAALEPGRSYGDSRPVTIEVFRLRTLADGGRSAVRAPSAFQLERHFVTRKCYRDSNNALEQELWPGSSLAGRRAEDDLSSPCRQG